ncbi:DUF4291 domain-containing protein [Paractinoplanes hotanensis]|uniref:DUF4291 domain-containing protein n=1 Tax=Paractinoplanes hotanensis TaxID=2906497 RepID=A0ABT0XQF0_9ACTN|nr:DUF4291 domain-containing protein [Actinoplanes hotanensis]MCM4075957.1 DUF4291 domain-containing protein [Actinoplanes hotanensis]
MNVPYRQIRAAYDDDTVTVYQAYPAAIARPALAAGRFVPPFKPARMTWIKPSFLWMMYRSGWATKPGQEHVLAVTMRRDGFEWALSHACLSHYVAGHHPNQAAWASAARESPVRVQWDPERSVRLEPLPYRSLQVGLGGEAVERYVDDWITGLTEVTGQAHAVRARLSAGDEAGAAGLLPREEPYPLAAPIAGRIAATT